MIFADNKWVRVSGRMAVPKTRESMRSIVLIAFFVAIQFAYGALAAPLPSVGAKLDTKPDRGNQWRYAFVTGPWPGIAKLYNDDVEISYWGRPQNITFNLAKNDVWDRRYFGDGKKLITLDDVRRVVKLGAKGDLRRHSDLGLPNTAQALYKAYDFPCPKPVGQIIFHAPDFIGTNEYSAGMSSDGRLIVKASNNGVSGSLVSLLYKVKNLLVIRGNYVGLKHPLRINFYRHKDTTPKHTSVAVLASRTGKIDYDYSQDPRNGPLPSPKAGSDGEFFWIRQKFPAEKTFPGGFEYVMMGAIRGVPYEMDVDNKAKGAGTKSIIHPIAPEVYWRLPGWLREVRIANERLNNAEYGSLASIVIRKMNPSFTLYVTIVTTRDAADPFSAAQKSLRDAIRVGADNLEQSNRVISDSEIRKWRLSRVMHYNATSAKFTDATPWHGDYHFNEGYYLPDIVAGNTDKLMQRFQMFEEMLPALKRNAREVYNCRGICFPLIHYPIKLDRVVYSNVTWEWGIENTALMLQPYWQMYQYTQDLDFLRKRAYPMMVEGARFFADYVTLGEDGYYHVVPTVSQEHWGFTTNFQLNRDSVGALSLIKYHLKATIKASETLGLDRAERKKWYDIVQHLAPYPTLQSDKGSVYCDVSGAPRLLKYNIPANLVMVLWAEDISLDSPKEILEKARRSYQAIPDKEHSIRKHYLRQIRLYLGMLEKPYLSPQGRVLSWPGRIHLYAGVPEGVSVNDSFSGLLAVGGFEVSAKRVGRYVRHVAIRSRAGNVCKIKDPWGSGNIRIIDFGARKQVDYRIDEGTIIFKTEMGHIYLLSERSEGRDYFFSQVGDRTIGKWTFDRRKGELVTDRSGNGHHAKLIGKAAIRGGDDSNGVLALNGNGAYALVKRTQDFNFSKNESFSVEAKVKIPMNSASSMISILCSMDVKQYCLLVRNGKARLYLSSPRGNNYSFVESKSIVSDGRWHTIRGVRDAADEMLFIYIDGKLDGLSWDLSTGDFSSGAPISIGAYLWGANTVFSRALIDDVEVKSLGVVNEAE